jgi:hypothetical protein
LQGKNASAEVTFERALINALVKAGRNDWSNQVPLISGIVGPHAFKKRAVDLVHRQSDSSFEFVELKIKSDTPVFAAIEILYGLLWLLSRRDREILGYDAGPMLDARELGLSVIAPRDYSARLLFPICRRPPGKSDQRRLARTRRTAWRDNGLSLYGLPGIIFLGARPSRASEAIWQGSHRAS